MPTAAASVVPTTNYSLQGWAAIASGFTGLIAFASLITYLATQQSEAAESGILSPMGRILLDTDYAGITLQALFMIPVSLGLHTLTREHSPRFATASVRVLGVAAFAAVALVETLVLFSPVVSDILFMAPMGFVGVWLIIMNWRAKNALPRGLRIVGMIAGIFVSLVGLNFFFNGGLAVLTRGPLAYANDLRFHIGLGLAGFPGFILFPLWSIQLGRKLLRA